MQALMEKNPTKNAEYLQKFCGLGISIIAPTSIAAPAMRRAPRGRQPSWTNTAPPPWRAGWETEQAATGLYARPKKEQSGGRLRPRRILQSAEVEVWLENWAAVELFCLMGTQWRIAMNGPTGLQYEPLFPSARPQGLPGGRWWQALDDIRVLEQSALSA